jgi:hypothetical protein
MMITRRTYSLILLVSSMEWITIMQLGLDGLGIDARFRIDNLIDRCLVETVGINNDKRLWMHQLVSDMGREIARQESPKCQRIWHHMEAFRVLNETTVSSSIFLCLLKWFVVP